MEGWPLAAAACLSVGSGGLLVAIMLYFEFIKSDVPQAARMLPF